MKTTKLALNLFGLTTRQIFRIACICFTCCWPFTSRAQCPGGTTSATINWDNLDFLHNRGSWYSATNPLTSQPFVSAAMWQSQKFAIGTNRMTFAIGANITVAGSGTTYGDITTHTGETGAHGTGADIGFTKTGTGAVTITLTFLNEVQNLKFSVFDIDQEITFAPTATNAAASAVSITLTKPAGASSAIPLNGNGAATTVSGTAPLANWTTGGGSGTAYANTSANGTVNVDIAGPVKTVVLTFSNDGNTNDFWISDITACVTDPGFPSNYYSTYTEPFTNQPAYFLANPQNLNVYMVNAASGVAEFLFTDPATDGDKMNSLAYDPVNKFLYYTLDNMALTANNKSLKKYDFNTETISTVLADITTLGIPTFSQGVEFAGAAFYNGSLYLGVEEGDGDSFISNAESVVWRIDFDGSGNPTVASQVFAQNGDNGASAPVHDWGDFVIKDGVLISHATTTTTSNNHYIHYNLQTGASTTYAGNAEAAGQLAQIWNGSVYRIKNNLALYNNDGTIGSTTSITMSPCAVSWSGNAGDGSDPFKPKCDFGDAPASYDPVALSPAVHHDACNNTTLRIGSTWDKEWSKNTSSDASGDSGDEDGIATVTVMNADNVTYNHTQPVTVLNNTGSSATLGAWLDYDADGVFEASEGIIVTVSAGGSPQNVNLTWNNLTIPLGTPDTYLRVRLVSGTGTMTTSNATGWFSDGEVEDYPVVSAAPILASQFLNFNVKLITGDKVSLNWSCNSNQELSGFEIQRSADGIRWENLGWRNALPPNIDNLYEFMDEQALTGTSFYRLKLVNKNNSFYFSTIEEITIITGSDFKIIPNPVIELATIDITAPSQSKARIRVSSLSGQLLQQHILPVKKGENKIQLPMSGLKPGIYLVELENCNKSIIHKMIKL